MHYIRLCHLQQSFVQLCRNNHVLEEDSFSSTSDHLPICMELQTATKTHVLCKPSASLPTWHKAKLDQIREYEKYIHSHADLLEEF